MILKINLISVDLSDGFEKYKKYLKFISKERNERINRYKFEKDKIISLFSELEMRTEISKYTGINYNNINFSYNKHGKPYLKGYDFHFSVSHSENYIAFSLSENPMGIDIEYMKKARLKVAKKFTENEYEFIMSSENPEKEFYRIWTSKEAYLKMLGTGLSKSLSSFDVLSNELKPHFFNDFIENYAISLYDDGKHFENPKIVRIKGEDLLENLL